MTAKLADVLNPRHLDRVHRTAVAQAVRVSLVFRESGQLRVLRESVIRILFRQHPEQRFIRSQPSEQRVNRWSGYLLFTDSKSPAYKAPATAPPMIGATQILRVSPFS